MRVRTDTQRNTDSPIWNAETSFWVDATRQSNYKLAINVFDQDAIHAKEPVGFAYVDAKEIFNAPHSLSKDGHVDVWVQLDSGEAVC